MLLPKTGVKIYSYENGAWECMKVKLSKVDDLHYLQESVNSCRQQLDIVVVLVKFADRDGNRIGTSSFVAYYVAPGEKLKKVLEAAPADVKGFYSVGVQVIKEDLSEVFKQF
jgi:hypothetical protein